MSGALRLVLLCLLALAVPFKAIAVSAQMGCAQRHHPAVHQHDALGVQPAQFDSATSGADAVARPPGGEQEHQAGHVDGHAPTTGEAVKGKCGTCAPCCAASAPATEGPGFTAPVPASVIADTASHRYTDAQADVPHRPPRS